MSTFRPPTDNFMQFGMPTSEFQPQETRLANRLWKHFGPLPRGRNIFLLNNGTYVEDEPADMASVVKTYYGGHDNPIDASEVASLTAAGYGAYIS